MKEVVIDFDNKSPADLNKNVNIAAFLTENDDVEYKFIEGLEGVWKTIKDFSSENICNWKPSKPGKYMIMVQGKSSKSKKSYDYLGKSEYEVIDNKKLKTPKESHDKSIPLSDFHEDNQVVLCQNRLMKGSSFLFLSMGIGSIISGLIQGTGLTFPSYIGAMIAAAIIRNFCDIRKIEIKEKEIEVIGNISLGYFLCIALMGLKLWELFDLALPLIVMLLAQSILMAIFAYFIIFSFMGKDYDAAVFASASCGFGMGATPNAVANMDALSTKFGFAPTPYFVVPIVGALFVDFVNSAVITLFVNILS